MIIAVLCLISSSAFSQNENRFKFYFNGSFGIYLPSKAESALSKNGSVFTFQFQTNYKDNYFTRIYFDQSNLNYRDNVVINGLNASIDDYVQTNAYGLDIGYSLFETRKLSYFAYVGGGLATMHVPIIRYDQTINTIESFKSNKNFLNLRGGVGVEYEFSKIFILYLETQYSSIPFKTDVSNKQLNGITTLIGFKTPLQ